MRIRVAVAVVVAAFAFGGLAHGQMPVSAPYAFTPDGRIEPTADQKPGTIAALLSDHRTYYGWTDATTAGFGGMDFRGRTIVYRDGADGPIYAVAVEVPCGASGCLSSPAPYDADRYGPFPWDGMTVWHDDIAPGPGTIGWHPPVRPVPGLLSSHRYVVQTRYIGHDPGRDHDWHTVGTHDHESSAVHQCGDIQEIAWQHRHGPHQCRIVEND